MTNAQAREKGFVFKIIFHATAKRKPIYVKRWSQVIGIGNLVLISNRQPLHTVIQAVEQIADVPVIA